MQSLDSTSFLQGHQKVTKEQRLVPFGSFMVDGSCGILMDLVGMAAMAGMGLYVRERLNHATGPRSKEFSLPDLEYYTRKNSQARILTWVHPTKEPDMTVKLRSPKYRQVICDSMQIRRGDDLPKNFPLVESYLLSCCEPNPKTNFLIRYLIEMGADPTVSVETEEFREYHNFWELWLHKLHRRFLDQTKMLDISSTGFFDTTKGLLTCGADINYKIRNYSTLSSHGTRTRLMIESTVTAMHILWKCFNKEPEFQKFNTAVEPLIERPFEKFRVYFPFTEYKDGEVKLAYRFAYPTVEEFEMLWPLIETFESTGHERDRDALDSAVEPVLRAHFPDLGLEGDVTAEDERKC